MSMIIMWHYKKKAMVKTPMSAMKMPGGKRFALPKD